jgi:hypothetical protein
MHHQKQRALAEEIGFRQIDYLVAPAAEDGAHHVEGEAFGLLDLFLRIASAMPFSESPARPQTRFTPASTNVSTKTSETFIAIFTSDA